MPGSALSSSLVAVLMSTIGLASALWADFAGSVLAVVVVVFAGSVLAVVVAFAGAGAAGCEAGAAGCEAGVCAMAEAVSEPIRTRDRTPATKRFMHFLRTRA